MNLSSTYVVLKRNKNQQMCLWNSIEIEYDKIMNVISLTLTFYVAFLHKKKSHALTKIKEG